MVLLRCAFPSSSCPGLSRASTSSLSPMFLRTWMAGTSPAMTSEKRTGYANLAVALPDQDQADRAQHGAIAGPLQLIDHEARWRPRNRAGALTYPQQADRKRQKADDRKRSGHGFLPVAVSDLGAAAACRGPP